MHVSLSKNPVAPAAFEHPGFWVIARAPDAIARRASRPRTLGGMKGSAISPTELVIRVAEDALPRKPPLGLPADKEPTVSSRSLPRPRPSTKILASAGLGALVLTGCTGLGAEEAGAAATTFVQQVSSSPDQACTLLSEQARQDLEDREKATCAQALPQLDLPPVSARRSVDVYEQHARVVLADDVLFLARFSDGWKVTAAGCEPQPDDEPYDCEIGG